jgi:hypothetical protein
MADWSITNSSGAKRFQRHEISKSRRCSGAKLDRILMFDRFWTCGALND